MKKISECCGVVISVVPTQEKYLCRGLAFSLRKPIFKRGSNIKETPKSSDFIGREPILGPMGGVYTRVSDLRVEDLKR